MSVLDVPTFAPAGTLAALPDLMLEPLVRAALLEDLGRAGDITTDAIVPAQARAQVVMAARDRGVVAGTGLARLAFTLLDPHTMVDVHAPDGTRVEPGTAVATITGSARSILTAERVALNFACHLSGIASATATLVDAVAGTDARVCCTRKTTPGLRAVEKAAVRAGGGSSHRFGLDDAVLIKDNHIAVAGSLTTAVRRAREHVGHLVKIEVEVDTLAQLEELLAVGADAVLLDNMDPATVARAVATIRAADARMIVEASGRVSAASAGALARAGVDVISSGALTHSSPILDLGLDHVGGDS